MNLIEKAQPIVEIPISSPDYPVEWKSLTDAPPMIYARGNIDLLKGRKFTVVGARRTPAPALKLGARICKELSESVSIVTGTADGGDGAAVEGALSGGGKVICVLAGGFSAIPQASVQLLSEVAKRGLLLSPYPYDTEVRAFSYEYRNKLLASLGEGVLVLGAAEKSGALITAKYAAAMGKKLFAIPYAPSVLAGAGCNQLIKNGAYLTETANDILEKYGYEGVEKKKIPLTETEEKAVEFITERGEAHVSEISSALNIPTYRLATMLSALEVKGAVVKLGGNRYSVV